MSTGEFGQKWTRVFSFFPTGPSDEYDSAPSRKYTGQFVPFSPGSVKLDKRKLRLLFAVLKMLTKRFIYKESINRVFFQEKKTYLNQWKVQAFEYIFLEKLNSHTLYVTFVQLIVFYARSSIFREKKSFSTWILKKFKNQTDWKASLKISKRKSSLETKPEKRLTKYKICKEMYSQAFL